MKKRFLQGSAASPRPQEMEVGLNCDSKGKGRPRSFMSFKVQVFSFKEENEEAVYYF